MKHLGDITSIDWFSVEPVDVVTGGSPCQDLSVAGKRAGLAGERSGLYMEQIRCVKELREADVLRGRTGEFIRPRYMVWENVVGAFSSGKPKGADFAAVIEEIIKIAEPDAYVCVVPPSSGWTKSGCYYDRDGRWSIAWRVHDAQFWGVPQRRKRIALVADFGGLSAPEILFERKGLSGDFEQSGAQGQGAAENTADRAGADDSKGECVKTYDARGNGDGETVSTITGDHNNRITDYTSVVVEPMAYGISSYDSNAMKSSNPHSGIYEAETSRTLDLNGGNPACNQGGIAIVEPTVAYAIGNGQLNQISMSEVCNTPDCMHDQQAVVTPIVFDKEVYNSGENSSGGHYIAEGGPAPTLRGTGHAPGVCTHYIVRRLTPLECERLQGYPDGWTSIGEWTDRKGKKRKEADSLRYKALGNSIALPFWKWLLKRISAQYERDATLGSLFDGIGGFPLCWEQINGKGTARWASEIEEFPMAVTKIRFPEEEKT